MSFLVCHVTKFGKTDLRGVTIHNNRLAKSSCNKDIDKERTPLNFDALGMGEVDYRKTVLAKIEKGYAGKKAIRKDAVMLCSVLVSSDSEFFKGMTNEQVKEFFKTSADYLAEQFGRENVVAAKVHLDEKTPHMHFTFIPLSEGRLCANSIITRATLRKLQEELPRALQGHGFNILRGKADEKAHHVPIRDFKKATLQVDGVEADLQQALKAVQSHAKVDKGFLGMGDEKVVLPRNVYDFAITLMKQGALAEQDAKRLTSDLTALQGKYKAVCDDLADTRQQAERTAKELEKAVKFQNTMSKIWKFKPEVYQATLTARDELVAHQRERRKAEQEKINRQRAERRKRSRDDDYSR